MHGVNLKLKEKKMKPYKIGNLFIEKSGKTYEMIHHNEGRYKPLMPFKYKDTAIDYLNAFVAFIPDIEHEPLESVEKNFAYYVSQDWVNINNSNYRLAKDLRVRNFPWFSKTLVEDVTPYLIYKKVKPQPVYDKMIVEGIDAGEPTKTEVDILVKNDVLSVLSIPYDSGTRYSLTHNHTRMSIRTYESKVKAKRAFKVFSRDKKLIDFFERHKTKDNMFKETEMVERVKNFLKMI